jgi:hypothetical protein
LKLAAEIRPDDPEVRQTLATIARLRAGNAAGR